MSLDFYKVLADAGIPTTQAAVEARWQAEMAAQNSAISNDSAYSPFWRIVTALITQPVVWLVTAIAETVLPNAFLRLATGAFLDELADGYNLTRKPAVFASGTLRFTRTPTTGSLTLPVGTVVRTAPINGVIYRVKTTQAATFGAGVGTLDVPVIAEAAGTAYNLSTGYYAILAEPIAGVSVSNLSTWLSVPGADVESDADLRARCRAQFGTAASHHTDSVYRSLLARFPGVSADSIWFVHDAPRGPGTANAFILFAFDAPVSSYLSAINHFITDEGNHGHGDDLIAYQMPETTHNLTVHAYHDPFLSSAEISALQTGITDFVRAAFRENTAYTPTLTLPYGRFSFSKLGQELHEQFPALQSLTFSLADIVSGLAVPRLGTLTVTLHLGS